MAQAKMYPWGQEAQQVHSRGQGAEALELGWCTLAANVDQETALLDEPPLRAAHRARISATVAVVEPGHPGHAAYQILDVSRAGLFVADDAASLSRDAVLRVGLPATSGEIATWADARVMWRGEKDGRPGVGLVISVAEEDMADWRESVREWNAFERQAARAAERRRARLDSRRGRRLGSRAER